MKKRDLIAFCRYYKGEAENPYKNGNTSLFWEYEKKWIELTLLTGNSDKSILGRYIEDYVNFGLSAFSRFDGVPVALKALLFNRYCYQSSTPPVLALEDFKSFYKKEYLS